MLTIGDLIKNDKADVKGNDRDVLCLQITASWEDIISGESE